MAIAQPIPPNLGEALDRALAHLGVRVRVRRQFGGLEAKPRPLVVILLDTLETASKPLRAWLPTHFPALFAHSLHWYHVLIVAAGRQQMPGLITTELPSFTEAESIEFLRHYYVHQQSGDHRFADPALQRALREDTPTRRAILELAEGIPLLLMLLAELAAHTSGQLFAAPEGPPPEGQQARLNYVVEHYIRRLEVEAQDDREAAERYRLLLYNAVPRRIPNDGLIAAPLRDLPGGAHPAGLDSCALFNRLRRESFVHDDATGGLVFHEVVREGFLAHLKASDRQRWRELHRRAAAWWQAEGDEVEALYHAVQADYEGVIGDLRRRIEAALEAQEWSQAQALIGATTELDLQPADQAWMTLYKAELAWGEGNRPLVYRRLGRLLDRDELPAPVADRLATDLERWFGFAPEMEPEAVADLDPFALSLLLWWARQRSAPRIEANALRGLGEAARRQDRVAEAVDHYQAALAVSRAIGDRLGEANALRGLGAAARRQGRYEDAKSYFEEAFVLYMAISMPFETLRFALIYANETLDQAHRHREQGHRGATQQALDLARWLLAWAEQAHAQTAPTVSAQYTLPLQVLRLRLDDFQAT